MKTQDWVRNLVRVQGKEKAKQIIDGICALHESPNPPSIMLFDEADWSIDHNGRYQYSKLQKFNIGKMEKRITKTRKFYKEAKGILKNGSY